MTLKQFSDLVSLPESTELDRATLIAFYALKAKDISEITVSYLCKTMQDFGLANPNQSRLNKNIKASRNFIKSSNGKIKLSVKTISILETKYPDVSSKSEEIISDETILPESLYTSTRGYLVSASKQINACFQYHLYDGCAMMMRRLIEMLIILTYKHLKRESEIKDNNGNFQPLSYLINYSASNKVLDLSKDSENTLDIFRQLGNYSAHGLEYSCRRGDIDKIKIAFRVCVEELMYKSGVRK